MPGLGGRFSTVVKAKVSKLLDRAEDPGETLDYGYNNSFHHTPEDTIDKLSPKSLEISGNAMLGTLALLNAGAK